jgi:hypothetical protein
MQTSETSIGEALSRIAETFGRLVVQHTQLLRSEVETEARDVARKAQAVGKMVAKAAPFILAGVVVASLALGQLCGLLIEPWLGQAAVPLATLLVGVAEATIALGWMKRQLPSTVESPRPDTAVKQTAATPLPRAADPITVRPASTQEKNYGAMG